MQKRLYNLLIIMMIALITTSCRFTFIDQPATVLPGDQLTVQMNVAIEFAPEPNTHKGVLCLLLPDDWSVIAANYASPLANGVLTASAEWADSAEACYPASDFGANMRWFAMISDTGFTYQNTFDIDITIELQSGSTEGCFNLGYLVTKATGGLLCSGTPSWAPLSYPHPVAVSSSGVVCDTLTVQRDIEWDNLLHHTTGWTGSDGIYSIPLSGRETPGNSGEQTLILFSDTFIGDVDSTGRRMPGWRLVNNTYAMLDGSAPLDENIDFFWAESNGLPDAVFIPNTPNTGPDDWYWLMDGIAESDSIFVFGLRMVPGNGGVFNFRVAGVTLISFKLAPDNTIPEYYQVDAPLYYKNEAENWDIALGQAIMPMHAASGYPNADGYIYVYGPRGFGGVKQLVAARVLPENIANFDEWRFWNGSDWGTEISECAPLTDGISQEFSVTPVGDKYYLVFQINNSVAIRIGDSPVGPFGMLNIIYETPEPQIDPDIFVYNAKAHPHLSNPGELLISYNVNTFDFLDHINDAGIYRPRFITLVTDENVGIAEVDDNRPRKIQLAQNYPNPFNPVTTIPFSLERSAKVELKIFNALGEQVRTLIDENVAGGEYRVVWDGKNDAGNPQSSGVYYYRFRVGRHYWSNKMVLVR